ncbi:hypothetical protein BGZ96_012796 [Linnemannia gamsii]|uniref:Uncharacterized protein n=1 Tax=Linnemannia gamsii TaxID=64522 RepID=A0ABQ7JPU3_9FUNG|nr:hypothetical protein BGZ96_012796 [Linnemannia gamsii]
MTSTFKPTKLIFLTFAMLMALVVSSTQQADAASTWCLCGDKAQTQVACGYAKGNWDGGSCGLDDKGKASYFQSLCRKTELKLVCWN